MLQCWVDIMPPGDAKGFPPADVALPPDIEFEVRLHDAFSAIHVGAAIVE